MKPTMNMERFEAIVAAYGADPKRWPADERDAAIAFSANAPDALKSARALDDLLALDAPQEASPFLLARLGHAARAEMPITWRPLLALAACAVFGLLIGYGGMSLAPHGDQADIVLDAALAGVAGEAP